MKAYNRKRKPKHTTKVKFVKSGNIMFMICLSSKGYNQQHGKMGFMARKYDYYVYYKLNRRV